MITINNRALKALCAFASTDKSRPHLCAVAFGMSTATATATDGHTLARVTTGQGDDDGDVLLVGLADVRSWCAAKGTYDVVITRERVTAGSATYPVVALSERPPPYEAVIPPSEPTAGRAGEYGVNPGYLARLAPFALAGFARWRIRTPDCSLSPIRCDATTDGGARATVVIMPMRLTA